MCTQVCTTYIHGSYKVIQRSKDYPGKSLRLKGQSAAECFYNGVMGQ